MIEGIELDARGRPCELVDRDGNVVWSVAWDERGLVRARLRLPDGGDVELRRGGEIDVVLGACDDIVCDSEVIARVAAVDWGDPRWIPAVDRPTALPVGAGTAILNLLAVMAMQRGTPALRYRGPYPTAALLGSLRASFLARDDGERAREAFERPIAFGTTAEIEVDFVPAPHRWHFAGSDVCVQIRDGLERVYVDGRAFDPAGVVRRLHRQGDGWVASFDVASQRWCEVLRLDGDARPLGDPVERVHAPDELVGLTLPDAAAAVLHAAIVERMAAPLRRPAAAVLAELPLVFGDAGFDGAVLRDGELVVHAAIAASMGELAPQASLAVLLDVVTPVVARAAQDRLATTWERELRDHARQPP